MTKLFYKTIPLHHEYEISKIKWSRFIGNVFHIQNKAEAEKKLMEIRKKYPDASHHCYAYTYGTKLNYDLFGQTEITAEYTKYSDEGEPSNTAGKPILAQIQGQKLYNILIIVTRYFGGTLLGVGWLIQAYGDSTKQTILHGIIQEQEITKTIQFTYTFDIIPIIRNILQKYQAKILSESYDKDITISIQINTWNREICKQEIINNSQGKIVI